MCRPLLAQSMALFSLLLVMADFVIADASGRWQGYYYYPDGRPPVEFRWELAESAGTLQGSSVERDRDGRPMTARLDGSRWGQQDSAGKNLPSW